MKALALYLIQGEYRLLTEALARSLNEESRYRLLGTAGDLDRAARDLGSLAVDVVLIDAAGGLERVRETIFELRRQFRRLKILPVGVASEADAVALFEAGADGFLLADASFLDLLDTVESVALGDFPCSPGVVTLAWHRVAALAEEERRQQDLQGVVLTRREKEILELIAEGLRNKEIAARLHLSLATVKNHVHRILGKLEVKGRHQAIRRAYENGLI